MRISPFLLCCLLAVSSGAQQTTSAYVKFGKITVEELQKKVYSLDSNANAIVLSDIGEAAIEGNNKGWFSIVFTRHRVVHILNKNGYHEGDVSVYLYTNGDEEEKLDNVKAITYNLENGKIVESKLDKSGIFKEKIDKNRTVRKFTMPNLKEGSIIEYEYRVTSDYIQNLDPWVFQGASPVLWSEFNLTIPEFFSYAFLSQGYHPFYINERPKNRQGNFSVMNSRTTSASERFSFTAGISDYRWVMKDVPELKQESYTSAIKNHLSRIEFQLSSQNFPLQPHNFRSSWPVLTKQLLESESFGSTLKNNNNWLSDEVKPVVNNVESEMEKANKIYAFVRDNYTCTENRSLWTSTSLKNVMKSKKGTVSEINLLLTAMLRYAGLDANPVILSTTDHGYALEMYPMITYFNYVVAQVNLGGSKIYLDASHTRLGFGHLLPECYNGHARVVDENATPVSLPADSLNERTVTAIFISNNDKGQWVGSVKKTPGYFSSYLTREKIKEKGLEDYFKELKKEFGMEVKIKDAGVDSLNRYELPVMLHYDLELEPVKEDILYINPMFNESTKKNPFKSDQRFYPVEMPFTMDETYVLSMEVPLGYEVDELPKSLLAKLDEKGSASFEYRISQSASSISMRTRLKIDRTIFMPDEYEILREFFNLVVSKQNEQIVFKKKK